MRTRTSYRNQERLWRALGREGAQAPPEPLQHWFYCHECRTLSTDRRRTLIPYGGMCVCAYTVERGTGTGWRKYLGRRTEAEAMGMIRNKEVL